LVVTAEENVGRFEVSVAVVLRVGIFKSFEQLLEIVSAKLIFKASCLGNEVKKVLTMSKF